LAVQVNQEAYIIIGDSFTFPDGNAATNRVYTYAKGFEEHGCNSYVICLRNDFNDINKGEANGIVYFYPYNRSTRSKSFLNRRWYNLRKYINTFYILTNIKKEENIRVILVYSVRFSTHVFSWLLSKIFNTLLILERSEHPLKDAQTLFSLTRKKIKAFSESKLVDGILCISEYLKGFYTSLGVPARKILLVPSTVDADRFVKSEKSPYDFSYICYCGSLTLTKDGVHILIQSFNTLAQKYSDVKLVLIGKADTKKDEVFFREMVKSLGIESRVIFTGMLSRKLVPLYLTNAHILALARPKSIVADAGFPSKLTEYLATGNPIVVTRTGEIEYYLTDNFNTFIAEPDSVEDFADKLDFVLSHYDVALAVGKKGQALATTVFNYNYQSKRLLSFIDEMQRRET